MTARNGRGTRPRRREGLTVIEALLALLLGSLLVTLAVGSTARVRSLQSSMGMRSEQLAAARTARHVLGREVRNAGTVRGVSGSGELDVRAFRGIAKVCPWRPSARELWVEVRGVRVPDPSKDSVELLGPAGVAVLGLVGRERTERTCPGTEIAPNERWRLTGDVPPGAVLARYFERGAYMLAGKALRYRRGSGGRQPLTPPVLRTPPSRLELLRGTVVLWLRATPDEARPFAWPRAAFPVRSGEPDG